MAGIAGIKTHEETCCRRLYTRCPIFLASQALAARLGGAYYVDDAEIGKVGSCEFELWSSRGNAVLVVFRAMRKAYPCPAARECDRAVFGAPPRLSLNDFRCADGEDTGFVRWWLSSVPRLLLRQTVSLGIPEMVCCDANITVFRDDVFTYAADWRTLTQATQSSPNRRINLCRGYQRRGASRRLPEVFVFATGMEGPSCGSLGRRIPSDLTP